MENIIYLIVGFGLGFLYGKLKGKVWGLNRERAKNPAFDAAESNREKLREYLETHDGITNNDVEKLLGVSDSAATRYMDDLEKEGLVRQVGDVGSGVRYEKIEN